MFHLDTEIGREVTLDELARAATSRCCIATGVYQAREIGGPGAGLPGIVPALDYLTASNRKGLGDTVADFAVRRARRGRASDVVVIGGGDTAMDCVRTAVRQGAARCAASTAATAPTCRAPCAR